MQNLDSKATQYWALGDTLIGYLIDGLVFCIDNKYFDYNNPKCSRDYQYYTFWSAASQWFAKKATGSAHVMLSGNYQTAILKSSTFYSIELPNIENVKKLTVLLLHAPNREKHETCSTGKSLGELKENLKSRDIEYDCNESSKDIFFYLCFKDSQSTECSKFFTSVSSGLTGSNFICIFLIIFGFIFLTK